MKAMIVILFFYSSVFAEPAVCIKNLKIVGLNEVMEWPHKTEWKEIEGGMYVGGKEYFTLLEAFRVLKSAVKADMESDKVDEIKRAMSYLRAERFDYTPRVKK